jgi:hypothetical protein
MSPFGLSSGMLSSGTAARIYCAGRVAVGAAVLARPEVLARGLRVDTATARRTAWLARMFAVRDLALGAGALHALTRGGRARPWLLLSALADAVDAVALAGAVRQRRVAAPPAVLAAGMAVSSVAVHLAAARSAD